MNNMENQKFISLTPPAAIVDDATLTVAELDTLNFDWVLYVLWIGASDIAVVSGLLTHGDTSGSGHITMPGTTLGTATNIDGDTSAVPSATDDNGFFIWSIDLRNKKRYIDSTIVIGDGTAGTFATVFAILGRGDEVPTTIDEMGAVEVIRVD